MAIRYEPVMTQSAAKQIADRIRESILDGRLKADDRLPTEHELAEQFDVSRPTIREALKRLGAQSLVRSRRGPAGGTFVNRPSQEDMRSNLTTAATLLVTLGEFDLSDIAEARRELETLCGRLAAERRDKDCLNAMGRELERQRDPALTDEEFCASDVAFHRALVDGCGNPVLQFVMFSVIEALQPIENMIIFRFRERQAIIGQHKAILDAVRSGDVTRTERELDRQMTYIGEKFAEAQASQLEKQA